MLFGISVDIAYREDDSGIKLLLTFCQNRHKFGTRLNLINTRNNNNNNNNCYYYHYNYKVDNNDNLISKCFDKQKNMKKIIKSSMSF